MKKVEIYTWAYCPFCIRAKALLNKKGVQYIEHPIDGNEQARMAMIQRANGRKTVPQIFIDDVSIGGCDELYTLEEANDLDNLLSKFN